MDTIKTIFKKIEENIKEYGYVTFNSNFNSYRFDRMVFNISIQYNKLFSENINFIIRNIENHNIIENRTVNIKDLSWIEKELEVF